MSSSIEGYVPAHIPPELVFDFDIFHDLRITQDVHRSYEKLHDTAPDIFFTPRNGGHWMVTRGDQIAEIAKDTEHFSSRVGQIPKPADPPKFLPLTLDPPASMPYRQALAAAFSPKAVNAMEPKIRAWAAKIVDEVAGRGECDFAYDVAALFPVSVFMELMGMPLDRLREFRALAEGFFDAESEEARTPYTGKIIETLLGLIAERRSNPGTDLISHLTGASINGRPITADEMLNMCFLLFLGGMDTVTNLTGFMYRHLAQDAELQNRLAEDPSRIPDFVEEGLRCFGVVNAPREVVKDTDRFGVPFRAGDMIVNCLPLAGRDDRKNSDPNRFDIDRPRREHLTFHIGAHLCIGHFLARAEIRILTEEWLKRVPCFSLKPGSQERFRLGLILAQSALPIQWKAAA
jgi:cytochrome P450